MSQHESTPQDTPLTRCVLHNVGHHDLFVEVSTAREMGDPSRIGWCRPRSSSMEAFGQLLYQHIMSHPVTYQGYNALRFEVPLYLPAHRYSLEFNERERSDRVPDHIFEGLRGPLEVWSVYAPLAHEILRSHELTPLEEMRASERARYQEVSRLVFILITAGQDQRSPRYLARVVEEIIKRRWASYNIDESDVPYLQDGHVACLHVDTDPHSVTPSQLLPLESCVVNEASRVAERHQGGWRDLFQLYLSVSTGTPQMIAAIALTFTEWSPEVQTIAKARQLLQCTPSHPSRVYRPKTQALSSIKEWVEVGEDQLNEAALLAVREVRKWREEYLEHKPLRPNELKTSHEEAVFFHRKGLKEVLCVVVIHDRSSGEGSRALVPIRGINLEVSLPTGTLCAERNAIGTALGRYPQLERRDIKAVAVLSLDAHLSKLGPCGACQEWFGKVIEVSPALRILGFDTPEARTIFVKPALLT